jgi:hypothetical protein
MGHDTSAPTPRRPTEAIMRPASFAPPRPAMRLAHHGWAGSPAVEPLTKPAGTACEQALLVSASRVTANLQGGWAPVEGCAVGITGAIVDGIGDRLLGRAK